MKRTIFITGTDTGVGKTLLTALLARTLIDQGVRVAALKPVCSGGREDARRLQEAMGGSLPLEVINPWHFRAPIAPVLAAEQEHSIVRGNAILHHIDAVRAKFEVVLIEGAGGLLSPLGSNFDSLDLICALEAHPVIVAMNHLGVVNQIRLTLRALPAKPRRQAMVVLMAPPRADASTGSNMELLARFSVKNVRSLPRLDTALSITKLSESASVCRKLGALAMDLLGG